LKKQENSLSCVLIFYLAKKNIYLTFVQKNILNIPVFSYFYIFFKTEQSIMKSMTGFGKGTGVNDKRKIVVEIRTLNSKQADVTIKAPNLYKDREAEIRNELINRLQRGKIELYIMQEETAEDMTTQFSETAIGGYYRQLARIAAQNDIPLPPDILNSIIRLPDALKPEPQEAGEHEWQMLLDAVHQALQQVIDFREQEGLALMDDMAGRIRLIEMYLDGIEKFEPQRMEIIRNRLRQNLFEYVGENAIDQNRFEQELIYYLEKIDVNEEKVRLRNHCQYFVQTMNEGDGVGKKLGFIAQEMGREINTIGSKVNHADMQQIVIQMKDELEKIKEQILNIL